MTPEQGGNGNPPLPESSHPRQSPAQQRRAQSRAKQDQYYNSPQGKKNREEEMAYLNAGIDNAVHHCEDC